MRAFERALLAVAMTAVAISPDAFAQEGLKPAANEDSKLPPDRPADRDIGQRRPGDSRPLEFFPPPAQAFRTYNIKSR